MKGIDMEIDFDILVLGVGGHKTREEGVCAAEAVAWLAGEPHSDYPECLCPVIGGFIRGLNDSIDDVNRQLLKQFLPRLVGTKKGEETEKQRSVVFLDYGIRKVIPFLLRGLQREDQAAALESLPEIDIDVDRLQYYKVYHKIYREIFSPNSYILSNCIDSHVLNNPHVFDVCASIDSFFHCCNDRKGKKAAAVFSYTVAALGGSWEKINSLWMKCLDEAIRVGS